MAANTITLDADLQAFVDDCVQDGTYADEQAVMQEAVRALQREGEHQRKLQVLRDEIQKGIDSGPGVENAFELIRKRYGLPLRAAVE